MTHSCVEGLPPSKSGTQQAQRLASAGGALQQGVGTLQGRSGVCICCTVGALGTPRGRKPCCLADKYEPPHVHSTHLLQGFDDLLHILQLYSAIRVRWQICETHEVAHGKHSIPGSHRE